MWTRTILIGAGAVVALVVAAGCSNSATSTEHTGGHTTSAGATAAATTAPAGQEHNDADVMFSQHMIPHHEQAIEMSDMLLAKQGVDPRVTELAQQIKAAQGPEIAEMQRWLDGWGNPPMAPMPSADMDMPGHGDMPGMSGGSGMMSEQDMTALQNAQGVDASKLFLTQMIKHHEGAITMAQNEIRDGKYPAAVEMARNIVDSQQKEIDTMNGILTSL
ncbi:DUF305 domain-containing protein [Mycobacterium sp.]|uniref:DUF305 domain-containing protein n=1 Tax=Mycobacterium sp. TaxID=1785 RepID=UPI002D946D92|nr:DUF305 domain-containing protein [Mycobacterium sp.]